MRMCRNRWQGNGQCSVLHRQVELEQWPAYVRNDLNTFVANDTSGKRQKENSSLECGPTTCGLIRSDTKQFTEFSYAEKVNRSHNPCVGDSQERLYHILRLKLTKFGNTLNEILWG